MFDAISKKKIATSTSVHTKEEGGVSDEFDFLFMSFKNALHEHTIRAADPILSKQYELFFSGLPLELKKLLIEPRAVLFRQVCTPSHEMFRFLRFAKLAKLKPLVFEYHHDKFVGAHNEYKKSLGKVPIYEYTGVDGRHMCKYKTILDFNMSNGKQLNKVKCLDGRSLIQTHHRAFEKLTKLSISDVAIDTSNWFVEKGPSAKQYYKEFFTLFIQNSILFENYFPNSDEYDFVKKTVIPAFRKVELEFGVQPMIVRLLPKHDETSIFWDAYPKKMRRYL